MKSLEELETETIPDWMADEAQAIYDEVQFFDENTAQEILQKAFNRMKLLKIAHQTLGFQNQLGFLLHGKIT
jgi:hypothetical protein